MHLARTLRRLVAVSGLLLTAARPAAAQLSLADFLGAGDQLLVTDAAAGLQWLTPVYTRNETFNSALVQGITATHGFRYATRAEVLSMIGTNFGGPFPTDYPGSAAGHTAAVSFLNWFGTADAMWCADNTVFCPRTQGFTADEGVWGPGTHRTVGLVQWGDDAGWLIDNAWWGDEDNDRQLGSWLVRAAPPTTTVPEPATLTLCIAGLVLLAVARRRVAAPTLRRW